MKSELSFAPVCYAEFPGWAEEDHAAALAAYLNSQERVVAGAAAPVRVPPGEDAREFFETRFVPHRVLHAQTRGLLTGYFEPVLPGSRERTAVFQIPVHRRPPDLVTLVDDAMRGSSGERLTHARQGKGGGLEPFPTRAEIESGALADQGLELLYLADPVEAFFLHVQGSGLIELTEGTTIRITYDGKNGHPYRSIGRHLIETGQLAPDRVSLESLAAWLRGDPERGRKVMQVNASYIFFRELAGDTAHPLGVGEIPLTPGRSLAIDASIHAIGLPIWVDAPTLTHATGGAPFRRLMIAQDVGSAITGPERGDIFFGTGTEAGRLAGITNHPGNLFVLLPRSSAP
jgi:membrane-bound lytic murein transglycosylase A